ncbi:MAG: hypothetical protein AABX53_01695 [Nanoarchaeota archaeon]
MKYSLQVAFGFVAVFLVVLLSQQVASKYPQQSFLSLIGAGPDVCGFGEGEVVVVYTEQGFMVVKKEAGCTCTKGSECTSGRCSCKLGANSAKTRCCHKVAGDSCTTNDECQSESCVSGKCEKVACSDDSTALCDSRPNGTVCKINDDCQSGKCRLQGDGTYECEA